MKHKSRKPFRPYESLEGRRYFNAGDLDPSYSGDGIAMPKFFGLAFEAVDAALQPDGKVVAAGYAKINETGSRRQGVIRLNTDGSLDTTFGGGDGFAEYTLIAITSIGVQGDLGIILGGSYYDGSHSRFAFARLQFIGSPDPNFGGGDGWMYTGFGASGEGGGFCNSLIIQRDNKIVGVGSLSNGLITSDPDFATVRLNVDGTLDTTYSGDGRTLFDFDADDFAEAVAIDYTGNSSTNSRYGQIIVVGKRVQRGSSLFTDTARYAVVRYNTNGSIDTTFDGNGAITTEFEVNRYSVATGIIVQPGSKIVVTGYHGVNEVSSGGRATITVRYNVNGSIDTIFGGIGTGYTKLEFGLSPQYPDIVTNYDGGFHVGVPFLNTSFDSTVGIAAYTDQGTLDSRFSGDGLLTVPGLGVPDEFSASKFTTLLATESFYGPQRRLYVMSYNSPVYRLTDVGSVITIGTLQPQMFEQGSASASFIVARNRVKDVAETIVLSTSGSVTVRGTTRDINATNILFGNGISTVTNVVIPAGQSFVTVTLTPIDDTLVEGDELLTISVNTSQTYDAGTPRTTTLVLRDNEASGPPVVNLASFQYETSPQSVSIRFNQSVQSSISLNDFQITGPTSPPARTFSYDNITNTATISFNSILSDGNWNVRALASGISNGIGQAMSTNYDLPFFVLAGDANRNRTVDFDDLLILAQNYGQSGRTFSQGNFDYSADGQVGFDDLLLLAQRYGTSVVMTAPVASTPKRRGESVELLS